MKGCLACSVNRKFIMIILKTANILETIICTGFQPFCLYTNYKANTNQEQLDHIQTTLMDSNDPAHARNFSLSCVNSKCVDQPVHRDRLINTFDGERGGLVVNASDSGYRGRRFEPHLGQQCCVLELGTFTPQKYW